MIKGVGGYGEEGRSGEEERGEKGGVEEGRRVWMEDERWRRGFEELSIARIFRGDVVEFQTGRSS